MLPEKTIKRVTRVGLAIIAVCVLVVLAHPSDTIALCALFGAILTACFIGIMREKPPEKPKEPEPPPVSNNFGSARYASPVNVLDQQDVEGVASGIFFGSANSPETKGGFIGAPVCSRPGNHTLITGKTRAGKGARVLLPSLLRINSPTSIFCIDPKGELAAVSARARRVHSDVHIMNPWSELGGVFAALGFGPTTYNPLDVLHRNDPNAVAVAQALALAICPPEGAGKDLFWNQSAAALLTAILLWQADHPGEIKTLARTRQIIGLSRKQLKDEFLVGMVTTEAFGGAIRENAAPFLDMAPETYSGVSTNLGRYTSFLSDPQIKEATSTSSFSMADLTGAGGQRPTTLYLVIPPDRVETQKTWLRLMITAGITTFKRKPPGAKYRCLFCIDEFANLGKIADFPSMLATVAGYGCDVAIAVQNLAQIREVYGNDDNNILSNCAYKWFAGVNDLSTAEYLSKTLGMKTIRTEHTSESSGESFDMKGLNPILNPNNPTGKTSGSNISYGEMGKLLMSVDEVLNMPPTTAILLAAGSYPHYLRPVDYWRLQEAFAPFRAQSPNLYWPLFFDPNPYMPANMQARCPDPLPTAPIRYDFIPIKYPRLWATEQPARGPSAFQQFVNLFRRQRSMPTPPPTAPPVVDSTFHTPSTWNEGTAPTPRPNPANPPVKIDFLRFASKGVKDHFANLPSAQPPAGDPPINQPTSSTRETAPEPPPSPVEPPRKINFRRYANWKPPENPEGGGKGT